MAMWPKLRPPAIEPTEKIASTMPASAPPCPNTATTPASIAAHAPTSRKPTRSRADGGRRSTVPKRALAAGDAHPPELGGREEPEAAADEEDDRGEDAPHRADLRGDEGGDDRADDPDDLLRRGVEREQRGELAGVDHLGIDRAHGRLDRRHAEAGERSDGHVPGTVSGSSAMAVTAAAHTARVTASTGACPRRPSTGWSADRRWPARCSWPPARARRRRRSR